MIVIYIQNPPYVQTSSASRPRGLNLVLFAECKIVLPKNVRRPSGGDFRKLIHTKHNISWFSPPQAENFAHLRCSLGKITVLKSIPRCFFSESM